MGADQSVRHPFINFNFSVELRIRDFLPRVCQAAFSECDGLEMTMEAKTIKEGGNNVQLHRSAGPMSYGTLTLRRGMSPTFDLWDWFSRVAENPNVRADGEVIILAADATTERARFLLQRCLPVKLKAPSLNAREGAIAIEELQLVYESLTLKVPGGGPHA
jgi:phage tail-like protein